MSEVAKIISTAFVSAVLLIWSVLTLINCYEREKAQKKSLKYNKRKKR